jgi:hypothetical protein
MDEDHAYPVGETRSFFQLLYRFGNIHNLSFFGDWPGKEMISRCWPGFHRQ